MLHICNFIKNLHHQGRSNCNFWNFSEFLENVWEGLEYRALVCQLFIFSLCAYCNVYPVLHFHIFKGTRGTKFDQKLSMSNVAGGRLSFTS